MLEANEAIDVAQEINQKPGSVKAIAHVDSGRKHVKVRTEMKNVVPFQMLEVVSGYERTTVMKDSETDYLID